MLSNLPSGPPPAAFIRSAAHARAGRDAVGQDETLQRAASIAALLAESAVRADGNHAAAQAKVEALMEEQAGAEERLSRAVAAVKAAGAGLDPAHARKAAADAALRSSWQVSCSSSAPCRANGLGPLAPLVAPAAGGASVLLSCCILLAATQVSLGCT